ncbi:2470_t:CDS:2 [Gigaspora margarita]|uniref:2470_t:CDS:1 n=1 Tax=Gigaspora margarita TaxID=4874 RepID=A0ABN7VHH3_GIGMA|nr:2470_t:CDS:2 [Gigaspora margarita]
MTLDMFYVQRTVRSRNRYYVYKICSSYQRNPSNEHINHYTSQQKAYYRNLFYRNQYPQRQITSGSTNNPGQATTTSFSSNQLPKIILNSGFYFLATVSPVLRAATSTSSAVAVASIATSSVMAVSSVAISSNTPGSVSVGHVGDMSTVEAFYVPADSTSNLPEQITETTTVTSSNQPLPVVDVVPEDQVASDKEESSDSTWLPVEFSEQSIEESSKEK